MSAQKREKEADLTITISKVVVVVSGGGVDAVLERTQESALSCPCEVCLESPSPCILKRAVVSIVGPH